MRRTHRAPRLGALALLLLLLLLAVGPPPAAAAAVTWWKPARRNADGSFLRWQYQLSADTAADIKYVPGVQVVRPPAGVGLAGQCVAGAHARQGAHQPPHPMRRHFFILFHPLQYAVDIDLAKDVIPRLKAKSSAIKVVCYFSAGSWEDYRCGGCWLEGSFTLHVSCATSAIHFAVQQLERPAVSNPL